MRRRRRIRDLAPDPDLRSALGPVIQALGRPQAFSVAIAAGVLLASPSLFAGFGAEDQLLRLTALAPASLLEPRSALDLFRFFDGSASAREFLSHRIGLWMLAPDFQVSLWRPLTSLTHAVDFALWPQQAWLMHAHNLLWYGLAIALAGALYRNFLGNGWIAAAAAILFAIDDSHGVVAGIVVQRHVLVAACLACICVAVHDRHWRDGWQPGLWLAPAFFLLALAASEQGVATFGYLVAYAWLFDDGDARRRAASLVPYALVAAAWFGLRLGLGHGIVGWDGWVGPLADPLGAALALVAHAPILGMGVLGLPFSEGYGLLSPWGRALAIAAGFGAIVVVGTVLAPLLRSHRVARFFAAGAVLSLVPLALAAPNDSLLLFPGIGCTGLLAQFLAAVVQTARAGRLESLRPAIVVLFGAAAALHVVLAPLLLPARSIAALPQARALASHDAALPDDVKISEQQLVIVNAPDLLASAFPLARRAAAEHGFPASARILSITESSVQLRRVEDDVVVLTQASGTPRLGGLPWPRRGTRDARTPLAAGDRIEVAGFVADILAADASGPTQVRFRFDVSCDNETLRWLVWNGTEMQPFTPPAVGTEVTVGAISPSAGAVE